MTDCLTQARASHELPVEELPVLCQMTDYLTQRASLRRVFALVDARQGIKVRRRTQAEESSPHTCYTMHFDSFKRAPAHVTTCRVQPSLSPPTTHTHTQQLSVLLLLRAWLVPPPQGGSDGGGGGGQAALPAGSVVLEDIQGWFGGLFQQFRLAVSSSIVCGYVAYVSVCAFVRLCSICVCV